MFNNREEEAKRENEHERKAKYALLAAAIKEKISPAQVIPDWDLRPTLDPASDATSQDTGQKHAQTCSPHKSMPNLWSVGTLEDGLSPGTP